TPLEGYSLRADTSNLPLGETIHLRFGVHGIDPSATPPSARLFKDNEPVTTLTFTPGDDPSLFLAGFTVSETGRYRAEVAGDEGKVIATQFIVFREEMETTETAMDRSYLEHLAKASGGRMIDPSEIARVVEDLLRDSTEQDPLT